MGYAVVTAVSLLVALPGCLTSPEDHNGVKLPTAIFPIHHKHAAWSSHGLIAYYDAGIVCVENRGGHVVDTSLQGIWILDPASGDKTKILSGQKFNPTWSPTGEALAFSGGGHVSVTPTDHPEPVALTSEGANVYPSWSLDGTWIAYNSNVGGKVRTWLVHPDGTGRHDVSPSGIPTVTARWMPDDRLVHIRAVDDTLDLLSSTEVFIMNQDGTGAVRITNDAVTDDFPAVSPDGKRVAVQKQANGELPQIWVMNLDGTEPMQTTVSGGADPDWSPDSTCIVYTRENWRTNDPGNGVLWVVDVNTGVHTQLTAKWPSQCGP